MNNFNMGEPRNRLNLLNLGGFFPFHSVNNYTSDVTKMKMDLKNTFGDNLYINNFHLIPDPLKKNLADSIITREVPPKINMASEARQIEQKLKESNATDRADSYRSLGVITNFISGVFNFVSGSMFHKRVNSPSQNHECYDQNFDKMAPSLQAWQQSKPEDQYKNGRAHKISVSKNGSTNPDGIIMNSNCRITAAYHEDKSNQVHLTKRQPTQYRTGLSLSCPSQVLVEQCSIEDCFEDAFTPEDFESFPDDTYLDYFNPFSQQDPESLVSDAPRAKTEFMPLIDTFEITSTVPVIENNTQINLNTPKQIDLEDIRESDSKIVSSCEDKMTKLKALLQNRQNKTSTNKITTDIGEPLNLREQQSEPISIPRKPAKEPSTENKQNNFIDKGIIPSKLCTENISQNACLQCSDSSSDYLHPCNYFDEVTGRFYSTSADSEDSFQVVFNDSPKFCRGRLPSECESEDSFIIFDDSPDSCYSSNDVFGNEINVTGFDFTENSDLDITNYSDSDSSNDSDSESDSGCDTFNPTCILSHTLTRTIGDLTNDSLYDIDQDEVDCGARFVEAKPVENASDVQLNEGTCDILTKPRGLLIDAKRKLEKNKQQRKTVRFSTNPPKVHVMRVWAFAARQARAGHWERHALDRERFKRRIADVDMAVSWVLKPQHRARVMFQRFMPWWNAQKRKELAEEKQKEQEGEKNAEVNSKCDAELNSELNVIESITEHETDKPNQGKCQPNNVLNGDDNDEALNKSKNICEFKMWGENLNCQETLKIKKNDEKITIDDDILNELKFGYQINDIDVST